MLYLIVAILVFLGSILVFKIKKDYLYLLNIIMLCVFFVIIPKILLMFNESSVLSNHNVSLFINFTDELLERTDLFIILFIILFSITYWILTKNFDYSIRNLELINKKKRFYPVVYISISFFSLLTLTLLDFSGYIKLAITYLSLLVVIIPILMVFRKYNSFTKIYFLISSLYFLYYYLVIDVGLRTMAIALLGSIIISVILYMNVHNLTLKRKQLILITFLSLLTFHIGVIFQYVRWNMSSNITLQGILSLTLDWKEAYQLSLYSGDLLYFYKAAVHTFAVIPDLHDYILGNSYLRIILFFLPASIFPNIKPEETQLVMATILNPERSVIGQSLPPSIIGDSYFNFGYTGLFMAVVYAIVIFALQKYFNDFKYLGNIKISLLATIFVIIILYIRGTLNPFYYFVILSFILIIVNKVLNIIIQRVK